VNWLGLDIGGANLKVADGRGFAAAEPFPLWQEPQRLAAALAELLGRCPPADGLGVSMTAELADCFATKAEGVGAVLAAVAAAAKDARAHVYLTDGSWAAPDEACRRPLMAAASNWHALARFAGRYWPHGSALLLDIGSTTADVLRLSEGRPVTRGRTDPERLVEGELVYTGVERSPVCAVVRHLPWNGRRCPVAQELFATARDAHLILGDLPEAPDDCRTADGRPATRLAAADRIARTICADRTMVTAADVQKMAAAVAAAQVRQVAAAARRVAARALEPISAVILSGEGEFLARRVSETLPPPIIVISLAERLGAAVSRSATAHALAVLAEEANLT
jgi:hypothetical protein